MKKEKTLNEKKETFRFWNENTQKWGVSFYRDEDVKQFIKEILDEFESGWMFSSYMIRHIIKQKAGFEELK